MKNFETTAPRDFDAVLNRLRREKVDKNRVAHWHEHWRVFWYFWFSGASLTGALMLFLIPKDVVQHEWWVSAALAVLSGFLALRGTFSAMADFELVAKLHDRDYFCASLQAAETPEELRAAEMPDLEHFEIVPKRLRPAEA